jgi:hypothetical protein
MIHPALRTYYKTPVEYVEVIPDIKVDLNVLRNEFALIEPHITIKQFEQHKIGLMYRFVWNELSTLIPYTKSICENLKQFCPYNSIYYRKLMPLTCYKWHFDTMKTCLHIPIITNEGCKFVYENYVCSMPANGNVYIVNNEKFHTFINAGSTERVHITLDIF